MAAKTKLAYVLNRQSDVAVFFGQSLDTIKHWAKQGMPGRPGRYEAGSIVRWLRSSGPWKQHGKPENGDPLLESGDDSPGLERYRQAKAALAELDLQERRGDLLSRDKARTVLGRWASMLRNLGDRMAKRYGMEAAIAVNETLTECESVIADELDDAGSADDSATE